ncbi:MAG TPA: HD domain-containing protein [Candidatus Dormibacteraeota bacterium]|nr:HD domain-containing protein [Candidatus Dormibacteraeota bacterium]
MDENPPPPQGRFDLVGWAATESERLLSDLGDRWRHVQGVVEKARWLGGTFEREDQEHLEAAAHLHDVGYSPALFDVGLHQLDGARYVRSCGHERLAGLVAHHSEARYELGLRGYAKHLEAYPSERSEVSAALVYCDLTTGPTGQPMEFADRLADVVARYGEYSLVAHALRLATRDLAIAMAATVTRLRRFGLVA